MCVICTGNLPQACADPEIFMRGGPMKMVIFGHRRGGSNPPKIPKLPFLVKIFKFQGGPDPRSPPSGSAHARKSVCFITDEPDLAIAVIHGCNKKRGCFIEACLEAYSTSLAFWVKINIIIFIQTFKIIQIHYP